MVAMVAIHHLVLLAELFMVVVVLFGEVRQTMVVLVLVDFPQTLELIMVLQLVCQVKAIMVVTLMVLMVKVVVVVQAVMEAMLHLDKQVLVVLEQLRHY
jgi:hypothetical protein